MTMFEEEKEKDKTAEPSVEPLKEEEVKELDAPQEQPSEAPPAPSNAELELIKQQNEFMKTEIEAMRNLMAMMGVNSKDADKERAEKERQEKLAKYARSF